MVDQGAAEQHTRRWLDEFVVGLDLCPFARPLLQNPALRIAVCAAEQPEDLRNAFLAELDLLQSSPESVVATSLSSESVYTKTLALPASLFSSVTNF